MKMITTPNEINDELIRLIGECSSCQVAVAWASIGFEAFHLLAKHSQRIKRMVVGTHFYQTHPQFIERFLTNPCVRFVLNPDGVFHPKVYLFEKAGEEWECLIGSPNFTQSGLGTNDEIAVLVTNRDDGAPEAITALMATIEGYWQKARPLGSDEFAAYREAWLRKQPALRSVRGRFGNPQREDGDDEGRTTSDVAILRLRWADYFDRVRTEKDHAPHDHSMDGRLRVIRTVQRLFADHQHFNEIDLSGRHKIAGLVMDNDTNYLWFGSMRGAGYFKQAINNNDENLSLALDAIPSAGPVTRDDYLRYITHYQRAFPNGGAGIATSTRLLAMKRPDQFVCLDSRNKEGLCSAFEISRSIGYEGYWDSIIERVRYSTWWCAPAPQSAVEREVWQARAAFLDSLFYDGKDMPVA
jgi:HKD family nuclease